MPTGRMFTVGRDAHFSGVRKTLECADDKEAVEKATQLTKGFDPRDLGRCAQGCAASRQLVIEIGASVGGLVFRCCARCARFLLKSKDLRTMQVPSILLGESRTRLIQGIVIGAVASMVIGFSWGGWVTGATANKLAAEQASTAVVTVLTPICVEKFMQNADAQSNLAALRKISSNWQQGDYLEKGGWATRPGATSPDYELGRACAAKLIEAKAASQ